MELYYFIGAVILAGGAVVLGLLHYIRSIPVDHAGAQKISNAIALGAITFLKEEYRVIAIVASGIAVILGYFASITAAACFLAGSALSLTTGLIGMAAATKANVRVALAAKDQGEHPAFLIAFFGGGVMGFTVATLGLLVFVVMLTLFFESSDFELLCQALDLVHH